MSMKSAVAALVLIGAGAATATAQPTLTISVYGVSQDSYKKALYAPFEQICGCTLVVETGNSAERLAKLEARRDAPIIDVAALSDSDALVAARKGLIQPLIVSKLPNIDKLYDFAVDPLGDHLAVGYTYYSTSIVFRSDRVRLVSWADLLGDKLKGRVALPNISTTQGPLTLHMLDKAFGGQTSDYATAIAKLGDNKASVVTFYERGAQIAQLFQQDEIDAAVMGRFSWGLITKLKLPIVWSVPKEGQTGGMNVLTLVKGSKNVELAHRLIDYWLSEEVQTKLALDQTDSPANRDVKVPDNIAEGLTYGEETARSLSLIPPATMLENREAWLAGWNARVAR